MLVRLNDDDAAADNNNNRYHDADGNVRHE